MSGTLSESGHSVGKRGRAVGEGERARRQTGEREGYTPASRCTSASVGRVQIGRAAVASKLLDANTRFGACCSLAVPPSSACDLRVICACSTACDPPPSAATDAAPDRCAQVTQ